MNVYLTFLGCKVNDYEVEALKLFLKENGYHIVDKPEDAHYLIVNTCDVTNVAKSKSLKILRSLKKKSPQSKLIAMGCVVEDLKDDIFNFAPIDAAIGTNDRKYVLEVLTNKENGKKLHLSDKNSRQYEEIAHLNYFKNHVRAYVKTSDGCDKFCSYCIIPYVRGRFRARDRKDIKLEIAQLIENGIKEIVLTGIDTVAFNDEEGGLVSLLKDILSSFPKLERLRLSSIEINSIDDELIDLLKKDKRLCHHLHISSQSGDDEILKKMHRHYDTKLFLERVDKLKEEVPDIILSTDIIVGFPSESNEQFNNTLKFVQDANFFKVHVFPYSERKGTLASKMMKDDVPREIKKERVRCLLKLEKELRRNIMLSLKNEKFDILLETYDSRSKTFFGLTDNYIMLHSKKGKIGDIKTVVVGDNDIDYNYKVRF